MSTPEALLHCWHPVARSEDVRDKPVAARLLDQPLALWRSGDRISAFYDLCIHRGTPLSLGWVSDCQLVCAYHGWHYGPDGACTRIPSLPPERGIPTKARARAFPVQERYGFVWVCLGEPRSDIPALPPEVGDASYRWEAYSQTGQWQANVARMVENLADYSHFPWVHPGTLGDREHPESPDVEIEPTPTGFRYHIDQPVNQLKAGQASRQTYEVIMPFVLTIDRYQPDGDERQLNVYLFCPLSSRETRYWRLCGRNFRPEWPDEELNRRHFLTFEQDRVLVEAQRPEELPVDLAEELHLRGPDTPSLEYRRRLRDMGISWT
ncbi:MAG TPA: aromatic ring-hydroxylating dioxygenase subunit alpha [Chloroflexota bacterium]|nr:aromatic ring-hydroxylating dioxygenase subunit alpha [Chloroflexota bacterium]